MEFVNRNQSQLTYIIREGEYDPSVLYLSILHVHFLRDRKVTYANRLSNWNALYGVCDPSHTSNATLMQPSIRLYTTPETSTVGQRRTTVLSTTPSKVAGQCLLPKDPSHSAAEPSNEGAVQFGSLRNSRVEFPPLDEREYRSR